MARPVDPIIPNVDACKTAFKRGFSMWSHYLRITRSPSKTTMQAALDSLSLIDVAFPDHPTFPTDPKLTRSGGSLLATGTASWGTTVSTSSICNPGLPTIPPQQRGFIVTTASPIRSSMKRGIETGYSGWYGDNDDHTTILILA